MRKFRSVLFCLLVFVATCSGVRAVDLKSLLGDVTGGDRGVGLLVSDVEFRKKQLDDFSSERELFLKRADVANRTINNAVQFIEEQAKETNNAIAKASGGYEDLLKKKLALLTERQQSQINFQEMWREVDGKFVRHIKLLQSILEYIAGGVVEKKERTLYSWKDLDEVKSKIDHLSSQVVSESNKRDRLKKIKDAEKEEISILKKEIETKTSEKEKADEEYKGLSEQEEIFAQELRVRGEVIEQEIDRTREKIEIAQFKIEDITRDERYKDDEIFLLRQRLNQLSTMLGKIQKRLRVESADVASAKEEFAQAVAIAGEKKVGFARKSSLLKARRAGLNQSIRYLEAKLAQLKKEGIEKSVEGYLTGANFASVKNKRLAVDRELDLLETEKEYADILALIKDVKVRVIEVLHKLGTSSDVLEDRLVEFRTKKRAARHAKKVLRDKQDEIISFISAINKEQEALQAQQKDLVEQQQKIFSGRGREYFAVVEYTKEAIAAAIRQKYIVERHFSRVSELLLRQEEVSNQYNFIVKYLESEWAIGMWKRSPRAISLQQLGRSLFEVEKFFQDLFWNTPTYVGPSALFSAVKSWDLVDLLGIILFFLVFLILFVVCKLFLSFVRKNVKGLLQKISKGASYLVIGGFENLFDFLLHHFSLLFGWFFVYVHVVLGLTYFKPLANPYAVSLFYLASIPILIYLSHRFVGRLKMLNQELQYMFISEPLQWKITLLCEIVLYATATLLPLRKAFLEYFDGPIAFSEVALAAYTLILIVAILFFFSKEDVLRLLSSRNAFVMWLRKKVDGYYYPVFGFFMLLLILSNSYIGYSNLAWYLAFAVPASIFLLYGLFLLHHLIRKYSLLFFIKEEDDEVVNKFENAKAYYGFFVAVTFVMLALLTIVALARIWGFEGYTLNELWRLLSEDWVIGKDTPTPLGFVELLKFSMFLISGLLVSSLIKRFILGKLFEIFRTEPGVQNTVSRILHYVIITITMILGFAAINLSQYALTVGGLLLVGVGFGLRDQIADYFAGVLVLLERPIEIGHFVETGDHKGKVHRISARSTTIKTARNLLIIIPNRDLISKPIINWGQGRYAVGCELNLMVSYDSDPELVQKILLGVISDHSMVLRVPVPLVRFEGFESSALHFFCRCFVSARKVLDMWTLQSELRFAVVKAFKENKIVIPYPQTVVHFSTDCTKKHPESRQGAPGPQTPIEIKFDKE